MTKEQLLEANNIDERLRMLSYALEKGYIRGVCYGECGCNTVSTVFLEKDVCDKIKEILIAHRQELQEKFDKL